MTYDCFRIVYYKHGGRVCFVNPKPHIIYHRKMGKALLYNDLA